MSFLKNKRTVVSERLGNVNESVYKMGDIFKVRTSIDVPKSLINAFVSKAKKQHNVDARENWSDVELAELFVEYINNTFLNVDSLPIDKILGDNIIDDADKSPKEVNTEVEEKSAQPVTPEVKVDIDIETDADEDNIEAEVQYENKDNSENAINEGTDLRCPNCEDNLGKDKENPKLAYCGTCGTDNIDNPYGYDEDEDED